jgi:acetylornithine deacetylase/succinyl-diaminopimelate desuccinylase-like protein
MAVQLWLAQRVAHLGGPQRGEIVFTFVSDEESLGPNGAKFLRDINCIHPDILILGGQTDNQLVIAERGVLWVRLTAKGRAAHAGDPEAGDNAIMRMVRLIAGLYAALGPLLERRRDGPLRSTINVGQFHGGHNTNVVPSICTAEIDRRLLPGEKIENAFAELREVLAHLGEPRDTYGVELLTGTNGFSMPHQGKAIAAFRAEIAAVMGTHARFLTATGVSDGRYFADDGIEIVSFGPGSGAQGHAANESVSIDQMVSAATIQIGVVARLLGLSGPDALRG